MKPILSIAILAAALVVYLCATEISFAAADDSESTANTWYVRAFTGDNDENEPLGSENNPFATLADVEAASGVGDTIIVLPSPGGAPLDGGIQLQPGQTLKGPDAVQISLGEDGGPNEGECVVDGELPTITNTSFDGDAVRLADNVTVDGLHIVGAKRGGIVGFDVSGVEIKNTLIEGFNFEDEVGPRAIRDESLVARIGAFGVAAFAGIHLRTEGTVVLDVSQIEGNCIRDGAMGINLILLDDVEATYKLEDNIVTDIQSRLGSAIQLITLDDASAHATIEGTFVDRLGFPGRSANSDKIRVALEHRSEVDLVIRDFVARNSTNLTGRSATGMELALGVLTRAFPEEEGMVLNVLIEDSNIRDMPSAGIQLVDTADNSDVSLTVRDTVVSHTSGSQGHSVALFKLPFVGSPAQGGRHTILLEDNELGDTDIDNVVYGQFSSFLDSLVLVVNDNVMANADRDGLHLLNMGTIQDLCMSAEGNDILGSGRYGVDVENDLGVIENASIDLGGGAVSQRCIDLGGDAFRESSGGCNRVVGSPVLDARVDGASVTAEHNWWGKPAGPSVEELNGGTIDFEPFLTEDSLCLVVNEAPVCEAGEHYTAACEGATTIVELDGSGSSDPDGDFLTYEWTTDCPGSAFSDPNDPMPLMLVDTSCACTVDCIVTLTVSDGTDFDTCDTTVTILDSTPPTIVGTDAELVLWPPDHKYHTVTVADCIASVSDVCDETLDLSTVAVISVSSDEPEDAKGKGDGNSLNDIVIVDQSTVKLRAERHGRGNGRVYTITYGVTDKSGNEETIACQVSVPHNQNGDLASDDGPDAGYTVTP